MKVLGLVLAGARGGCLEPLTNVRTIAAIPVFGKYRSIDFTLSNMVNAGISKVGIITQYSPRSLMDHLGSGKEWDLDRKHGGLFILQPIYSRHNESIDSFGYRGTADSIFQNMTLLKRGNEDHVLIGSGDHIFKIDFSEFFKKHVETGADITILTKRIDISKVKEQVWTVETDDSGRVLSWKKGVPESENNEQVVSLGVYFINKFLLRELLYATVPQNKKDFLEDIVIAQNDSLKVLSYDYTGYWSNLSWGLENFYDTNMDILNRDIRKELFLENGGIYTKLKDLPPPKITSIGSISNSLISDGCVISGEVSNSVVSRKTYVRAGATVKNSVIFEGCVIEEGATVENAILDKYCVIRSGGQFIGNKEKPSIAEKNLVV
ncbi:MAG: glucose-1-phosphate adenylyltransferase subunit GlgD [Kosmotogaceae bacterium]